MQTFMSFTKKLSIISSRREFAYHYLPLSHLLIFLPPHTHTPHTKLPHFRMYRLQIPHSEFTVLWVLFCSLITWLISFPRKCPVSLTPSQAKVSSSVPLQLPTKIHFMYVPLCVLFLNEWREEKCPAVLSPVPST